MICPLCYPPGHLNQEGNWVGGYQGIVTEILTRQDPDGKVVRRCDRCGYRVEENMPARCKAVLIKGSDIDETGSGFGDRCYFDLNHPGVHNFSDPLDNLPRIHPREKIVNEAKLELRKTVIKLHDLGLTTGEFLRVLTGVLGDQIQSIARDAIRQERHGNEDKPGGLE